LLYEITKYNEVGYKAGKLFILAAMQKLITNQKIATALSAPVAGFYFIFY
jgi:hypothetical protein